MTLDLAGPGRVMPRCRGPFRPSVVGPPPSVYGSSGRVAWPLRGSGPRFAIDTDSESTPLLSSGNRGSVGVVTWPLRAAFQDGAVTVHGALVVNFTALEPCDGHRWPGPRRHSR